jgi:hypothetical protein
MSDETETIDAPEESPTSKPKSDIDALEAEAKAAVREVLKLEAQASEGLRKYEEASAKLAAAKARRDIAVAKLDRVKPPPLPPIPTREQMLAMARAQRPDADDRKTVELAARMHALVSDGMARAGERAYDGELPEITGPEVRNIENHRYNLPPPREPRERKSYG